MSNTKSILNLEGREKLRASVEVLLASAPTNKKIQLPKETLEQLLFEEFTYNDKKYKLPIWSGDFLKKLDLSQISFEDVSWSVIGLYEIDGDTTYLTNDEDYDNLKKIDRLKENSLDVSNGQNCRVCYAGTNAMIDFTKSMEVKELGIISIMDCDFSNCDFSANNLSNLTNIEMINISNCNFSNSKTFNIPPQIELTINYSNFENTNLSNIEINGLETFENKNFIDCNFKNTGLKISLSVDSIKQIMSSKNNDIPKKHYQELLTAYLQDKWIGCYLNGSLVRNKRQEAIDEILNLISEQINPKGSSRR